MQLPEVKPLKDFLRQRKITKLTNSNALEEEEFNIITKITNVSSTVIVKVLEELIIKLHNN